MKFRDDIYVYEWTNPFDNNCNSYYIGGAVRALIDPGLLRYIPDLLERMEHDNVDTSAIRHIINTHSHPDHFEGSEHFVGGTIGIGLHSDEIKFLNGPGGELYSLFGLASPSIKIDRVLEEGELTLGDESFQLLHVPGHSPGSVALYSQNRSVLFSGDVIFDQSIGRTDFPGGNGPQLKRSIEKISQLDVSCIFPGHMGIIDGKKKVKKNFEIISDYFFPHL